MLATRQSMMMLICIFTFVFLTPAPSKAAALDASHAPWYVIGKLRVEGVQSCTATLVGPNTVITAAHCIYNRQTKRYFAPKTIHFLAGVQDKTLVAQSTAISYSVAAKHLPEGQFDEQALLTDWALIKLKEPIGCMLGSLKTGHASEYAKHSLVAAGYPMSNPSQLIAETQCQFALQPSKGKMLRLKDCGVEHGDSGAALIATEGNVARVLGIISAGTNDSKGRYRAFAVPSEQFQKHIEKAKVSCDSLTPSYP